LWLKVVDVGTTKIVGVAQYKFNPTYVPLKPQELNEDAMVWLEDEEDRRIAVAMMNDVQDRKLKYLNEAHIQLEILFVLPEYRRQGIGSLLLKWGCDLADHLMLPLWVEAAETAHSLYLKHGLVDIEHARLEMGRWSTEYTLMRLTPKTRQLEIMLP